MAEIILDSDSDLLPTEKTAIITDLFSRAGKLGSIQLLKNLKALVGNAKLGFEVSKEMAVSPYKSERLPGLPVSHCACPPPHIRGKWYLDSSTSITTQDRSTQTVVPSLNRLQLHGMVSNGKIVCDLPWPTVC